MKKSILFFGILMMLACNRMPENKYTVKSGYLEYETKIQGARLVSQFWFDDYGQIEVFDMDINFGQFRIHERTLKKDNQLIIWDFKSKKETIKMLDTIRMHLYNIDFSRMDDFDEYDLQLVSTNSAFYKDYDCQVYEIIEAKAKTKFWVYQNLILKKEEYVNEDTIHTELLQFNENVSFPDSLFSVFE